MSRLVESQPMTRTPCSDGPCPQDDAADDRGVGAWAPTGFPTLDPIRPGLRAGAFCVQGLRGPVRPGDPDPQGGMHV